MEGDKGSREQRSTRLAHQPGHIKQHSRVWGLCSQKRDNYTCFRDDYKTKIPTKLCKMAQTEQVKLKKQALL